MDSPRSSLLAQTTIISVVIFAILFLYRPINHYPVFSVETPDHIGMDFFIRAQENTESCSATLNRLINIVRATCPDCQVSKQQCVTELLPEQRRILSKQSIAFPSTLFADGVTIYRASDPTNAKLSCEQTAIRGKLQGVICFDANTERLQVSENIHRPASHGSFFSSIQVIGLLIITASVSLLWIAPKYIHVLSTSLLALSRRKKQILLIVGDLISIEAALWLAFFLRFDTVEIPYSAALSLFMIVPLIAIPIFIRIGLYRTVIRHLGLQILITCGKAILFYSGLLALITYLVGLPNIPRSVIILQGLISLIFIGFARISARYCLRLSDLASQSGFARKNIVIYGAGSAGIQLAAALANSREMRPVALIDDDPTLHRHRLGGLEVYAPEQLGKLIERWSIQEVLLALPSASRGRRNEIIATLEPLPVHVRTLPGMAELAEGKIKTADLREVEIEDLLGREPVEPNYDLLQANITGKNVMVSGAGGSIGSELCRQILDQNPARLILVEISEFALYSIEQDLITRAKLHNNSHTALLPILASVTDQARIERVIKQFGVQTIYHAAAYKHVPMVERNPCEGVINNVFGTYRIAQAAIKENVDTFVLISTDKAVRPTNTMGTTKRFAELVLQALAERNPDKTRFTMVRFGNVLGSSGSVVPLFREQIRRGGPITVTDPRIIRYFMTIPEAAQLVIQAGAMGQDGDVFVLDMGEPVKIVDLAERMIHLSGLSVRNDAIPNGDIEIVFSGLRPGEKLYEELLIGDNVSKTAHPRIMRANEKLLPLEIVEELMERLGVACPAGDSDTTREILLAAVEEFAPQCGNQDLLL